MRAFQSFVVNQIKPWMWAMNITVVARGPLSFYNKKENVWPARELQILTIDRSTDDDGVEQICKKTKSSNVKARSRLSRGSVKHEIVVFKTSVQRSSPTILTSNPKNKRETLSLFLCYGSGNFLPCNCLFNKWTTSWASWFTSFSSDKVTSKSSTKNFWRSERRLSANTFGLENCNSDS